MFKHAQQSWQKKHAQQYHHFDMWLQALIIYFFGQDHTYQSIIKKEKGKYIV